MNKIKSVLFAAGISLALGFVFGCSSGDEGGGNAGKTTGNGSDPVKKDKISGFSQKGPFTKGSAITLYELSDKLAQTGRSFEEIISDDKGSFEIKNIELVSPYVMLKVNGFYRNEVTGNISSAPINLYAIADIREKSNINVNILTHLEYYRVQKLVEGGKSLKDAKKQAQKEILAIFNISGDFKNSEDMSIFGTSDGDAALLAISVLLQSNLSEGQFTERLADFNLGFREIGVWDNEEVKNKMADWAAGAYISYDDQTEYLLNGIRKKILNWNLSTSVPDFEKYVNSYWYVNYGFGTCDATKAGEFKDSPERKKDNPRGRKYICKDNAWVKATNYELDVGGLGNCSTAGEINKGNVSDKKYTCKNNVWVIVTKCLESKSCLTFTDTRDMQQYYYVKIGEQTWMAENLNYKVTDSACDNRPYGGRLYNWATAMKACPVGWHLPSDEEWQELIDSARGQYDCVDKLVSGGTDDYGFSALPTINQRNDTRSCYDNTYSHSQWWTSSESSSDSALFWGTTYGYVEVCGYRGYKSYQGKGTLSTVRCVQD